MRSILYFICITTILFPGSFFVIAKKKKRHHDATRTFEPRGSAIIGDSVYDHFGEAVALSDDGLTLAIGAPYNGDGGYIQVFRNSQTQWQQMGHAIIGETLNEQMGSSIALSGDGYIIACGARGYDTDKAYAVGRVRVFALTYGGNWLQMGSDLVGHAEYDLFGYATTLSGNGLTLAVGSPYFDSASTDEGLVQVFSYVGSDWVQKGSDLVGDWGGDNFGASLSLSWDGLTLAVGSPKYDVIGDRNEGLVRVYMYGGSDWSQKGSDLLGSMNEQEFGTGLSLSNSGSIVACGSDKVHVYTYDNRISDWRQIGEPIGGTGGKAVKKAFSLSGDGMTVAVGGWIYVESVVDEGKVSVYGFNGNEWTREDDLTVIIGRGHYTYCESVSISNHGNIVASKCITQKKRKGEVRTFDYVLL